MFGPKVLEILFENGEQMMDKTPVLGLFYDF